MLSFHVSGETLIYLQSPDVSTYVDTRRVYFFLCSWCGSPTPSGDCDGGVRSRCRYIQVNSQQTWHDALLPVLVFKMHRGSFLSNTQGMKYLRHCNTLGTNFIFNFNFIRIHRGEVRAHCPVQSDDSALPLRARRALGIRHRLVVRICLWLARWRIVSSSCNCHHRGAFG